LLGGAAPEFMHALSTIMPVTALIHHPLCLENGLDDNIAENLKISEQQGLECVSQVITSSPSTSNTVAELFGFERTKIHTVLPGVTRTQTSKGSTSHIIHLLCVGSIIERKGHKNLLQALSMLKNLNWRLDCYGKTEFDKGLFGQLQDIITKHALSDKVKFHGAVSDETLEAAYKIPDTVPKTCGILVEPENIEQLSKALKSLINDKELRDNYRQGAINAEPSFPTWQSSANQFAEILKDIT